ncbi:Ag precursor [Aplysia californica]|uniref:Ag n=1 Tax=Aplysia californica TaxID=6500 RepID=Q16936_APLCA|nr:Ag precursor [Aplysia californica]AAB17098.1 Ag [Aplysia californica]
MKLFILLFAVMGLAECTYLSDLTSRSAVDTCAQGLQRCVAPIQTGMESMMGLGTGFSSNSAIPEDANIDTVCTRLEPFQVCLRGAVRNCHQQTQRDQMTGLDQMIGYICSARGRANVREMQESECATNELKGLELVEGIQGCSTNYVYEVQMATIRAMQSQGPPNIDLCGLTEELRICVTTEARDRCGTAYETFVNEIWAIASRTTMRNMGCAAPPDNTRRFALRALDI